MSRAHGFRRFFMSRETHRTFALYMCIGVAGVAFYVAILSALLTMSVQYFLAFTIAFVLGVSMQFIMNRWLNFRASGGAIGRQATAYVVVTGLSYAIMMGVGWLGVNVLKVTPLLAYLLSIPVNLPVGYLANRYVTFGRTATSTVPANTCKGIQ